MVSSERPLDSDEARLHRVLANSRRRHVLDVLGESDSPVTLADLAADLASRESDETADRERIERVQISLYHNHVPKLDDVGIVEFDATERTVSLDDSEEIAIANRLIQSQ